MKRLFSFEDGEGDITLSKQKCKWPDQDIFVLRKEEDNDSIAFTWIELLMLHKHIGELYKQELKDIKVKDSPLSPYAAEHPIISQLRRVRWNK